MTVTNVNKDNFEGKVLHAPGTAVVDFWADWCMPCRMFSPVVEQFADKHPEITVAKVNVEENPELAARFHVMSIPAVFAFKNGVMSGSLVGVQSKEALEKLVQ